MIDVYLFAGLFGFHKDIVKPDSACFIVEKGIRSHRYNFLAPRLCHLFQLPIVSSVVKSEWFVVPIVAAVFKYYHEIEAVIPSAGANV